MTSPDDKPDTLLREELAVIPVIVEQLRVDKEVRELGRVRITKTVEVRDEPVDVEFLRDEVSVERVEIGRPVDAPVSIRYEGDTLVLPVHEEILVLQKQLVLREELRVRVTRTQGHDRRIVRLRAEKVTVENSGPNPRETPHENRDRSV